MILVMICILLCYLILLLIFYCDTVFLVNSSFIQLKIQNQEIMSVKVQSRLDLGPITRQNIGTLKRLNGVILPGALI